MQSDVPLDYAVFQLSPRRSRCELFVSYDDTTEKLASGLVKSFVTHLKVVEEQLALAGALIKLDVERFDNAETWFTKGTLERFVRFVSKPDVLEMVNTFDAEMSQLEVARKIYSQGVADDEFSISGGVGNEANAAPDATKKELLRAIDVRLSAVKQDLTAACSRASDAGFNAESISNLQLFADHFGAHRLSEACCKFITNTHRRADLFNSDKTTSTWKVSPDTVLRSSIGSDMSLDDSFDNQPKPATCIFTKLTLPSRRFSREPSPSPIDSAERESTNVKDIDFDKDKTMGSSSIATNSTTESASTSAGKPQLTRRLSVQERISLFENKAQISPSSTTPNSTDGKTEVRLLSSDVNLSTDKAALRRWSGASDMSIDVSGERKESDNNFNTPTPDTLLRTRFPPKFGDLSDPKSEEGNKDSKIPSFSGRTSDKDQSRPKFRSRVASFGRTEEFELETKSDPLPTNNKSHPWNTEQFGSPNQSTTEEKLKGLSGGSDNPREEIWNDSGTSTETKVTLVGNEGEIKYDVSRHEAKEKKFKSEMQTESFSLPTENSGLYREQFQGNGLVSDQVAKRGARKESSSKIGGSQRGLTGKGIFENQENQRVKQLKGNQGVNDELTMKANELEKLFAEHKLRVPGDQSNSVRKVRPAVMSTVKPEGEPATSANEVEKFHSTPLLKPVDSRDYDGTPKHNIYSLSFVDGSRGNLYLKYIQKRDAKIREDWSSNRPEKEAQMKAMQDSLEKSRAEMKVKLTGSAEKRNSTPSTRKKHQQTTDMFMSYEGEGQAEFPVNNLSEAFFADSSTKSAQSKRAQPNKNTLSPGTRTAAASIPRSSGKASNFPAGRRRLPNDNPLAQSVPNFSDLKKENTKPLSAASKPVRPQVRTHTRKKSTTSTTDLNTSRNSDDVDTPSKIRSRESADFGEVTNDMVAKIPPRKGNVIRRNAGPNLGISKASVIGESARNGHSFGDITFETQEVIDDAEFQNRDYQTTVAEESIYLDNINSRLSNESDKSGDSVYENNYASSFVSQAILVSDVELPNSMPPLFRSMGSTLLESPGESPGYWNSRLQNQFAFSHETSDIDASDSPNGSPASWSFHTVSQSEVEAAGMRKKWGAAQKPIVGIDSSHSPSRKDVTRGLKRFLRFGRKNRASDNMADWISATTSEGDDSEDGRDFINRCSEDLRKSRMGFSQSHNSDEGLNEIQALQSSIPTPLSNFKVGEDHLSAGSVKEAPGSLKLS